MVPKNIQNVHPHMQLLGSMCGCKKKLRNSIIQSGSRDFISAICECAKNFLDGNVPMHKDLFEKLRKNKSFIRNVTKKSSLKAKKRYLIQHGGFLQFLIPAAISALSAIISNAISN